MIIKEIDLNKTIYLDYQATTPLCDVARKAMDDVENTSFANPHSSDHVLGWKAASIVDDSTLTIANYINAIEDEIVFTSGATESNNLAIVGVGITAFRQKKRNRIVVSEIEHKCVLGACKFLKDHFKYEIIKSPVDKNGIIDLNALERIIDSETLLVSIMAVNNEIGTVQPIKEIGETCRKTGAIFHVDASQALYEKIDVIENNIDLLSLSAHKMYGPKGIGALFISNQISIQPTPLFQGGGQQNHYRSGSISPHLAAGFSGAIKELQSIHTDEKSRLDTLRKHLVTELNKSPLKWKINGDLHRRHPGNLSITFPGIDAKALIGKLQPNIAISTGSACTSGTYEPSHVLCAIGLSTKDADSTIRISLGRPTKKTN